MAIYAGILVVVMLMIKLTPLVTLGDTWAQVCTHRPSQPAAPYLFLSHYCYCTYLPAYLLAPTLLVPECMHTQGGSFKVYHFSAWYGVIFVVAAAFHVAVAPFLFSYAKACWSLKP